MVLRVNSASRRQLDAMQKQLAEARAKSGMEREALAKLLEATDRSVRDWERCYTHPSTPTLVGWAYTFSLRLVLRESPDYQALAPVSLRLGETLVEHEMRRLAAPLKIRREERGIAQQYLALMIGVSRSSLQRWEDGPQIPIMLSLLTWADRLKYTVELAAEPTGG